MVVVLQYYQTRQGDAKKTPPTYTLYYMMQIKSSTFVKGIRGTDPVVEDGRAQICFVGRSNVGKSSLLNSLLGQKNLAKTGKKPGKTTEINFFLVNPTTYFVDLPGYGYAKVGPKQKDKIRNLIFWYLTSSGARLAVVVLVLDVKAGFTEFDAQTVALLKEQNQPFVIVANKSDKLNQKDTAAQLDNIRELSGTPAEDVVLYSSQKNKNGDALLAKLSEYL